MKRLVLKTIAAAVALAAFGVAHAQDKTIKFATQNPKGHPIVTGMEKFADLVAAKSGGKIKVNLFPGGVLGSDFRVHGVRGLRVVDASVFPRIPGYFIVSAIYMIGEKAADVILESAGGQ